MSNIPEYKTGGVADVASINAQEGRIEQQGFNAIARGAQSIGQAAMSLQQIEIAKRDRVERHDAVTKNIELKQYVRENEKVLREQFAKNPNDPQVFESYKKDVQSIIDEQSSSFKNAGIRKSFENMSKDLLFRGEESLKQWQAAQTKENVLLDNKKGQEIINQGALDNPNLNNAIDSLNQVALRKLTNTDTLGENFAEITSINQSMETAGNFIEANLVNGDIGQAKSMIKDQRIIDALGTKGILRARKQIKNAEDAQRRKAESLNSLKFTNSWKFLEKTGDVAQLKQLNFADPGSFLKRESFLEDMSEKYPGLDLSNTPIHPAEVQGLQNFVRDKNDIDLNNFIGDIDRTLSDDQIGRFAKQLFPKDPAIGAAIQVSGQDPEQSLLILKGSKRLQSKSLEINTASIDTAIDQELLNVIDNNQARNLMKEAVKAHLVETVYQGGGDLKEDFKGSDLVTQSVDAILGPKITLDDSNVVSGGLRSFRGADGKFLDNDQVNELFEKLTPENMRENLERYPVLLNGERDLDVTRFGDRMIFQTVGDGKYSALDTETGSYIEDQNGDPFVLDLKQFYNSQDNKPSALINIPGKTPTNMSGSN